MLPDTISLQAEPVLWRVPSYYTWCRGEEERLQAQTSRYHGVRQNKRSEKWESYIRVAGRHLHLGCHDSEVAAAQAFDQAVMLRHVYCRDGENAVPLVTNFAPEYYQVIKFAFGKPSYYDVALCKRMRAKHLMPVSLIFLLLASLQNFTAATC